MNAIKEISGLLGEEGDLIANIKGVGKKKDFALNEYVSGLEGIVDKQLSLYQEIKDKILKYKKIAKIKNGKNC